MGLGKILIAGEEPIIAYGLKVQFERWNFERVDVVETWNALSRQVTQHPYDLLVIDLGNYSDQGHPRLMRTLRDLHPLPVIVLTAFTERLPYTRSKAYTSSFIRRIAKPCPLSVLQHATEELLHRSLGTEAAPPSMYK